MELNEAFYYDPTSPSFLRWKVDVRSGKGYRILKRKAGDMAGGLDAKGRYVVRLGKKPYLVARVVWEMHNGPIPDGMVVDHENGFNSYNAISNLRMVTQMVNARNKKLRNQNTIGTPGVYWRHDDKAVIAEYSDGKTRIRKTFSVEELGVDAALRGAIEFRLDATPTLRALGYTERHIDGN